MPTNLEEFGFYPLTWEHKVEHNRDCQKRRERNKEKTMAKLWKLLDESSGWLLYKWNGEVGKGKKFKIFRGDFNSWYAAQVENEVFVDFSELQAEGKVYHITHVAEILGLS